MDLSVYLLPHQDDETFAIPKIRFDLKCKRTLVFVFLTQNSSRNVTEIRQKESRKFLTLLLGRTPEILDIGLLMHINDGDLFRCIDPVVNAIHARILSDCKDISSLEIICPAYEGGHQDHDAAFIVAQRLKEKAPAVVLEYFLYNGYGTSGKLYKVVAPYQVNDSISIGYSFIDRFYLFLVIFIYRSQLKSMLGLWPFTFAKSIFYPLVLRKNNRLENESQADSAVPLYERWGRVTKAEFIKIVNMKLDTNKEK